MRFGMFVPQGWRLDLAGIPPSEQWATMRDLAQAADAGPFESIWVYDHFHTVPVPTEEATHEAWSLMSAFAASTTRVRLGQMCTCMGYRNPAYLAKVAATVDVISGGRVEMGIGGGWYEHEWRAYGYGFPSAGDRLGMLDEGVQIMRQLWTTGTATLSGKHYQVDGGGNLREVGGTAVAHARAHLAEPHPARRDSERRHQRPGLVSGLVGGDGDGVEVVVDPDRLERRIVDGLSEVPHRGPLAGGRDASQIEAPALRDEKSESHGIILLLGIAGRSHCRTCGRVASM